MSVVTKIGKQAVPVVCVLDRVINIGIFVMFTLVSLFMLNALLEIFRG